MADRNEPIKVPGTSVVLYRKPKGVLFSGRPGRVEVGDHTKPDQIALPWANTITYTKDQIPSGVGEGFWELWRLVGYDDETGEELYAKTGMLSYRTGRDACVSATMDIAELYVYVGKTAPV